MKLLFITLSLVLLFGIPNSEAQRMNESGEIIASSAPTFKAPMDSPYEKHLTKERRLLPYDHIRESDVVWEKRIWRVIDVREKMNQSFAYPENPLISVLLNGVMGGDLQAYSTIDDKFTTPMSARDLNEILNTKDTVTIFDPDTYVETIKVVENDFNPETVKRFRVKESWFFDKETSTLQVRILGIAPLMESIDDNGNVRFELPIFWIYYPHARNLLAHQDYFNPNNDISTMSWEDIFEMRYFASHIVKESNVQNRRLEDYLSGEELLHEGEKIKEEIRNYEHDVWSY